MLEVEVWLLAESATVRACLLAAGECVIARERLFVHPASCAFRRRADTPVPSRSDIHRHRQ
jgi:hypothetical protein